eukprot:Blabericola_migrator_1__2431@NODE_1685_length_4002_cov_97_585260_g1092_i0_p1_GENE_NODE_1685_length_4002_cov_97_585260_g1092_i0NODE_1685_length_4002_cov_97_585260_g1092_i0_p1_ORF_typecomplete_len413_score86_99CDC27/PF09507_10/0_00068HHV5_US34A/PF17087_5/0_14Herpes_LMP1/PF05297_11/0_93FAM176/PF14851_6/6_7_NODE_1685_length_4002_cov_97_585260_g1092_i018573095
MQASEMDDVCRDQVKAQFENALNGDITTMMELVSMPEPVIPDPSHKTLSIDEETQGIEKAAQALLAPAVVGETQPVTQPLTLRQPPLIASDDSDDGQPFVLSGRQRRLRAAATEAMKPKQPAIQKPQAASEPRRPIEQKPALERPKQRMSDGALPPSKRPRMSETPAPPKRPAPKVAPRPKAAPKAAPKRAPVARAKAAPARSRRRPSPEESDEDSDEGDSDDDEDVSSDDESGDRRPRQTRQSRLADDDESGSSDVEDWEKVVSSNNKRDVKSRLIAKVLSRWWYVMEDWPPADYDYQAELEKRKLKQVAFDQWEEADDVDSEGFTKVYQITHFPGIFRDPQGKMIDLRPLEGKPCFSNFKKLSEIELTNMLKEALKKQMELLNQSPYAVTDDVAVQRVKNELNRELRRLQ